MFLFATRTLKMALTTEQRDEAKVALRKLFNDYFNGSAFNLFNALIDTNYELALTATAPSTQVIKSLDVNSSNLTITLPTNYQDYSLLSLYVLEPNNNHTKNIPIDILRDVSGERFEGQVDWAFNTSLRTFTVSGGAFGATGIAYASLVAQRGNTQVVVPFNTTSTTLTATLPVNYQNFELLSVYVLEAGNNSNKNIPVRILRTTTGERFEGAIDWAFNETTRLFTISGGSPPATGIGYMELVTLR